MENLQRTDAALRSTVALVALLNFGYFGVEFAVALAIGSVSLFADSIDFLEDATVNGLILVALGWNARRRSMSVRSPAPSAKHAIASARLGVLLQRPAHPLRRRTRPQRWHAAVAELLALQVEYVAWLEAMPEPLRDSATGEALQAIVDLDLDELLAIEPPRGFGRD